MSENIIEKILKSREDRYLKQEEILSKYPFSLVSFTLNIPGENKDKILYRKIHNEGIRVIGELAVNSIDIIYKEIRYLDTGPEGFISMDINPLILKKITVDIENTHALGRLFDIDVFDNKHNQISRKVINEKNRKCLICDDLAINCIKTKRHSNEELIKRIEGIAKAYF